MSDLHFSDKNGKKATFVQFQTTLLNTKFYKNRITIEWSCTHSQAKGGKAGIKATLFRKERGKGACNLNELCHK